MSNIYVQCAVVFGAIFVGLAAAMFCAWKAMDATEGDAAPDLKARPRQGRGSVIVTYTTADGSPAVGSGGSGGSNVAPEFHPGGSGGMGGTRPARSGRTCAASRPAGRKTTSSGRLTMPDLSTCGELADYLATKPRDRKVILSKDAEGDGFSPLADARESLYAATSTWSGSIYPTPEDLAGLIRDGSGWTDEDAAPGDAERVIVLGPVN